MLGCSSYRTMLLNSQSHFLLHPSKSVSSAPPLSFPASLFRRRSPGENPSLAFRLPNSSQFSYPIVSCSNLTNAGYSFTSPLTDADLDRFGDVGNELDGAAGQVIRKYFRKKFEILDKQDLSPVTIADQLAEEFMVSIISANFPSHAIYGEEHGWRCKKQHSDFVWVLDPIDGTKSFITGKPLFGTHIALLHGGIPILGIIDQPVLKERWFGICGRRTRLNGEEVSTRICSKLSQVYMYSTSPHWFKGNAEVAFARVRNKVKVPLYGRDCYSYALLASGYVDLVVECGLKEGAGGIITDWKGNRLCWEASSQSRTTRFNVVAAGDPQIHGQAIDALQW